MLRFANGALGTFIVSDATAEPVELGGDVARKRDHAERARELLHVAGTRGSLSIPQLQHWSYDKPTAPGPIR